MKISDFGTSREWNEKSTIMSFAGTVAWMAPEVILHEPCSEKIDVWLVSDFNQQYILYLSTYNHFINFIKL